ncbi:hypothetical protein PINS_up019637 [Pythium insidiosum]|nr:hypothetical protein PINS_up019637 [Pythium insidiosum]
MADPVVLVKMLGVLLAVGPRARLGLLAVPIRSVPTRSAPVADAMGCITSPNVMANASERGMDWPSMKPLMLSPIPEEPRSRIDGVA